MKKYCLVIIGLLVMWLGIGKAQITNIVNFNGGNGQWPGSNLLSSGNVLYGTTAHGGVSAFGSIFSVHTDGSGFNSLYNFQDTIGYSPTGTLTLVGNKIYGVTSNGGPHNAGMIYCMDTNGSGFNVLYNFWQNGSNPIGTLVLSGNVLYGMGNGGGLYNYGCVFSIDTDGTNYKEILDFNDTNGAYPYGSLKLVGSTLYGMTQNGGLNDSGCVFSIDTTGGNYKDILDFNGSNGSIPLGEVTISGNTLYGMTSDGGAYHLGAAFSIHTDGSAYKKLIDFDSINGSYPQGSLTLSDNNLLGMTEEGGVNGLGVLFVIDTNGSGYNKLFDFNNTNGGYPVGSLTYSNNVLYGTTVIGGPTLPQDGVVFGFRYSNCPNIYSEPICIATIDTATNNAEVIWGRTNSPPQGGYGYYNIYLDSTSGYVSTHTQPLNVLSEYVDMNSNPSIGPVSYELSTVDSCGESALSAPHTTIYLTTAASPNAYILNWTAYVGFTPTLYRIFRGPALNAMVQIDSVSNATLTYTDSFPPLGSYYAIEAVSPSGVCIPTTKIKPHGMNVATLSGSFSNGFNTAILGVENVKNTISNLNIYPNPSNGMMNVNYTLGGSGNIQMTMLDELGQVVYDKKETRTTGNYTEQLNLENLAPGIYSLRMQTNNSITVKKVVVMKNK